MSAMAGLQRICQRRLVSSRFVSAKEAPWDRNWAHSAFFSAHRPLAMTAPEPPAPAPPGPDMQKIQDFARYNDEYAKLFGAFTPFTPPTTMPSLSHLSRGQTTEQVYETSRRVAGQEESPESLMQSFLQAQSPSQSPSGGSLHVLDLSNVVNAEGSARGRKETFHLISVKKIRKKKMNKHKWKKLRRGVRNSTRYNKERLRKQGVIREKQE